MRVPVPAKWIFISGAVAMAIVLVTCILSPSLRFSFVTGWEVRALVRFRERFKPENYEITCPNYRLYQAAACVRDIITEEHRLQYASMTGRIYYLATMTGATDMARENAHSIQDQVEATLNLLEYLNDEMKIVLLRTGGEVDLSPLDSRSTGSGLIEDPEIPLRRRYYANLVDLWVKTWRRDEKMLSQNRLTVDARTRGRIDVLRADRDELFSRFSFDLSRYSKKRLPANAADGSPEPVPSPLPSAGLRTPSATAGSPTNSPMSEANRSSEDIFTTPLNEEIARDPSSMENPIEPVPDESGPARPPRPHLNSEPDPVPTE